MPQPSVYYACGRVGVLGKSALHTAQLERLMATHTYEEARRALTDIGYIGGDSGDFQSAADAQVKRACELVEKVTPQPALTGCFQLRYDVHNLKVLLKSRFLAQKPKFLSQCGTLKVDTLQHAVTEHRYGALPQELQTTLNALEKELARRFDPMLIDAELDKSMYRLIFKRLSDAKNPRATQYFTAKVDLQNYIMLLRVKAMRKDAAFFAKLFLPCGSVKLSSFQRVFDDPEHLSKLALRYGQRVGKAAAICASDFKKLPLMEKAADDYLYGLYKGVMTQSVDRLIGYLLRIQRETTDVRLIMTAKLNGFDQGELEERVRELNG